MKKLAVLSFFLITISCLYAQEDTLQQRIFLIGDAGELYNGKHPTVDWLKQNVDWNDERNVAIYLGDNIYPLGLPMQGEEDHDNSKQVMDYLIGLVKDKKGRAIFVPGNHDWKNGKIGGWQRVINQVDYINGLDEKNIEAWPRGGCPGPVLIDISDKIAVVAIDSQWFLYVHDKPGPGSSCDARTLDEFETQLNEIVASRQNQLLIVAMHHPIYSFGPHGGAFTWKEHIFPFTAINPNLYIPLPILGSVYPIARGVFGSLQDVKHPLYQTMNDIIERAMRKHPNPIHVAGHDHNLQMVLKDSVPFIVSGSAAKLNRIEEKPPARLLFSDVEVGFATIEVRKSGNVETKFYNIYSGSLDKPTYSQQLKKIDTIPQVISKDSIPVLPDSVMVAANPQLKAGGFKKFLMGENYRQEWTTPIRVEVLDLGKELGGLSPQKLGGGKQTRSLRVEDQSGKEWSLRSVQKFPDAAIPPDLRQGIVQDIVEDGVSASHPFGSLSVPVMANAAGIPYLRRKVVFVPDDPRLGRYRDLFKNTLALLEEREPEELDKSDNTDEIILKIAKDNDRHVDQTDVLRARLLDNFYMDFDRHEGQWRWSSRDTGKGKIYYPIPKDQDQVFFVNEGILPKFVVSFGIIPELQGFRPKAKNINTFNRPARNFDRFFLTELNEDVWSRQIDTFLMAMTDSVIERALQQQPLQIQQFHNEEIINKLKERRRYFKDEMLEYYRFISREVNIVGSNQRELFTVDKNQNGTVRVTVSKIDKEGQIATTFYNRVFDPNVTKELRLYGLEDADSFVVRGGITPIRIRIIGGPGNDHFRNEASGGNVLVYDVSFEENSFSGNESGFAKRISANPRGNEYARLSYKYNQLTKGVSAAWNIDDGLFVGARAEVQTHGFRKEPYAMRHYLSVHHALRTSSWRFRYDADFTNVFGLTDFIIRSDVRAPVNVTNFFGLGNNTVFDNSQPEKERYYRARYNFANASFLLRRKLQSWMEVNFGPTLQYFHLEPEQNAGKFVSNTLVSGLDPATMYDRKWFAGAEGRLLLNSRNNQDLPTRGFMLNAGAKSLFGVSENTNNVTQLHWDMNVVASFGPRAVTIYAARFGVATNIGAFEFPQAQYLSGTENLRGYRRNRFAGRTIVFQNTDIRFKIADFITYLFPGSIGVQVFHDIGRVWMDNEDSRRWHNGYGAGIWVSPIKRFVLTGSVVHSKEEKAMPYFTFGFQF